MLLAKDINNNSVRTKSKLIAFCPNCNERLIAKCGKIKIWHWAHKGKNNCSYKPETLWHLDWKQKADNLGHLIEYKLNNHIADIVTKDCRIIELQHSFISEEDLLSRCNNAQKEGLKIDWIFDLSKEFDNDKLTFNNKSYIIQDEEIIELKFNFYLNITKFPIKYLFNDNNKSKFGNVWFDLGIEDKLFFIIKMYNKCGHGYYINIKDFFEEDFFNKLQNIIELEKNEYFKGSDYIRFNEENNYKNKIRFISDCYKTGINRYNSNYRHYKVIKDKYITTLSVTSKKLWKQLDEIELKGNIFEIIRTGEGYETKYEIKGDNLKYKNNKGTKNPANSFRKRVKEMKKLKL